MCEPDSEVARWGLNLLDVEQIFSSTYYGDNSQHDKHICPEQYSSRDTRVDAENDEIIAHTLHEEFSQLTVEEDDMGPPSSSCSSPGEKSCDGEEEEEYYNLEITDESAWDGEVEKRLNQIVPIPHVPRINGDIPSIDEATSDHQRLLNRLQLYDLVECKVQGDGNCQFRALSDQFYRSPEHHKFVRQQVVNQLKSDREVYEGYVPMEYNEYLKKMSKSGEWGDHVTLQAAADAYGVKIIIFTSFKDTCSIEIQPKEQKSKRVIFLSFWAEVHYNSIYPQGEQQLPCDIKRKKRWWQFGSKHY
ncbi:OVARIAN TUMOR DOMAIN-containing deubiquitinating enzyme 12-like [Impatiens glandulifera]|uniref:OVARIAN TUMOR DOMAIN-containing deubiquitinating enzyme 12-like n=1 Tax=Impatiens glandulifera TaxID=253017 RepID=UPI001FB0794E|nr:OVARIAN TUMOR DOMAIN-containing deubiquitinating enzyme 12-like [Impatiens glandulifera]